MSRTIRRRIAGWLYGLAERVRPKTYRELIMENKPVYVWWGDGRP